MRGSVVASATRGLIATAIFFVGGITEIATTSSLPPHCTDFFTVGQVGPDPSPWTAGEIVTVVGPAALIAVVIYFPLRTPLWATCTARGAAMAWSTVTGLLM